MTKRSNSFNGISISNENVSESGCNPTNADTYPMHKQKSIRFGQDTKHRRLLIKWMMAVVSAWLGIVLLIIILNNLLHFYISDKVLVTLLATTTINVLGLSKIILHGMFETSKESKHGRKKYHKK